MSEALLTLRRQHAAYAGALKVAERQLEKAEEHADEARAAQHDIDTLKLRMAEIEWGVRTLEAAGAEVLKDESLAV